MRLDKFLSNENIGSRKAVGTLVRSGAVAVNGQAVRKSDIQIDPEKDEITVNGKTQGCADRFCDHGYEDHTDGRTGTSETYRRRGFPAGNLPCGAPRTDAGRKYAAGTVL